MKLHHSALPLLAAFWLCAPAQAATFCVSNGAALANALDYYDSVDEAETVTIRIVQGTYNVGDSLTRFYGAHTAADTSLKLLGGYTANCAARQAKPSNTVIDGANAANSGIGLMMKGNGTLLVEGLTFTRFKGATTLLNGLGINLAQGETLLIDNDSFTYSDEPTYEVRQSRFIANAGQSVVNMSGAQMRFVNNVIAQSTLAPASPGNINIGAAVFTLDADLDGHVTATNNTITGTTGGPGMRISTLITGDSDRLSEVTDNLLWNNASDFLFTGDTENVYPLIASYNLYNTANGNFPQTPLTDLHSDPRFVNAAAGDYRLASNSPAINRGAFGQVQGFPPRDADGATRIVGSRIDIGAYESTIDDATTAIVTNTGDNGSNTSPTAGSLRAAIKAANAASGPFTIRFNLSGSCPQLLSLTAPMLDITGDVTIDATTVAGWTPNGTFGKFDGNLCLVFNGTGSPWALHVPSTASTSARLVVRGLGFAGFTDAAIKLEGGRNHRVWGSQFGAIPLTVSNRRAIHVTGNSGGAFVGGYDDEGAVNLVSGSTEAGILLDNASGGSTIANNVIGYLPDGRSQSGNQTGISVFNSKNNTIQYNFVGHSATNGIALAGAATTGSKVQYNRIGMDVGNSQAPNGGAGVLVNFGAHDNTIGGPVTADWGGNIIAGSDGPGVWASTSAAAGNSVLNNQFYGNDGIDIDLAALGPSANQATNPGSGANNLQNWPLLASVTRRPDGADLVAGTLTGKPSTTYRVDVYYGIACGISGRGFAMEPLGKAVVTTGAQGSQLFLVSVPAVSATGPAGGISATATDPAGNTSEIGNCVTETIDDGDTIFKDGFEQ